MLSANYSKNGFILPVGKLLNPVLVEIVSNLLKRLIVTWSNFVSVPLTLVNGMFKILVITIIASIKPQEIITTNITKLYLLIVFPIIFIGLVVKMFAIVLFGINLNYYRTHCHRIFQTNSMTDTYASQSNYWNICF